MKVWKLDDCDYVAGEDLEQVLLWYLRTTGVHVEEHEEASLELTAWTGEAVGDGEEVKFSKMIEHELRAHGKAAFPQILATDGHYA